MNGCPELIVWDISSLLRQRKEMCLVYFVQYVFLFFFFESKGFQAINQHVSTKSHKNNAHCKLDSSQLRLTIESVLAFSCPFTVQSSSASPVAIGIFCVKDEAIKAERYYGQ